MLFHSPRSLPMTVPPSTSFQDGFFVAKLKKTSNKVPATERKGRWIRGLQERCLWHCLMVCDGLRPERIKKDRSKVEDKVWGEDLTATAFGFARARAYLKVRSIGPPTSWIRWWISRSCDMLWLWFDDHFHLTSHDKPWVSQPWKETNGDSTVLTLRPSLRPTLFENDTRLQAPHFFATEVCFVHLCSRF